MVRHYTDTKYDKNAEERYENFHCREYSQIETVSGKLKEIFTYKNTTYVLLIRKGTYAFYDKQNIIDRMRRYCDIKDEISISFIKDSYFGKNQIISVKNLTKDIEIISKKKSRYVELQKKAIAERERTHLMMRELMSESYSVALIATKEEDEKKYTLKKICGFTTQYSKTAMHNFFAEFGANVNKNILDYLDNYTERRKTYLLYIGRVKNKYKPCSCDPKNYDVRNSLTTSIGTDYKTTTCENCFFEELDVYVPDEIVENFTVENYLNNDKDDTTPSPDLMEILNKLSI